MIFHRRIICFVVLLIIFYPLFAENPTVYITKTGSKYHRSTCSYLRSSKTLIALSEAMERGYEPCSRCDPPTQQNDVQDPGTNTAATEPFLEQIVLPYYETHDAVFFYSGFALKYNEQYEQAEWVAYLLTDYEVRGTVDRSDRFRADDNIPTGSASLSDYKDTGYDRGHLAPAADMKWSEMAMDESFLMSNMSPQDPGFNRGIWKELEKLIRDWAVENEEVYVVTGPVLTDDPYTAIGENEVAVPKRFYKVILDNKEPELKAIGFILANEKSDLSLMAVTVSVDVVERETGIDFFYLLPAETEDRLESTVSVAQWEW